MKWSGLAPAVDSHLERWSLAKRAAELTDPIYAPAAAQETAAQRRRYERDAQRALTRLLANDLGGRWLTFALSYGLPDADGIPTPAITLIPHEPLPSGHDAKLSISDGAAQSVAVSEGSTISGREQFHGSSHQIIQGTMLIKREFDMLDAATTHYVSAEVVDEVTWAAEEAFPEPLFDTDLFTPVGFAVLETPVAVPDLHYETGLPDGRVHVHIRAIGWRRHKGIMSTIDGTVGDGVSLFLYTTPQDYIDGYCREMAAIGRPFPNPATEADIEGPFLPVEVIPWRFGVEWGARPDDVAHHIPGTVPSPVAYQRRWFYAFMRLCWQQIIVRHTTHEPRHNHRRWERLARRKELLDYTTLRLRRVVDPDYKPTGMGLPLDHRVKVRAHWHYAYCSSIGGPARLPDGTMDPTNHRWVWIESHWRGPEDGPLGPLHSATSVVR